MKKYRPVLINLTHNNLIYIISYHTIILKNYYKYIYSKIYWICIPIIQYVLFYTAYLRIIIKYIYSKVYWICIPIIQYVLF